MEENKIAILNTASIKALSYSALLKAAEESKAQPIEDMNTGWKLFIDDERNPITNDWVIARTSQDAIDFIISKGMPYEIAFDHDLGGEDTSIVFIKWLFNKILDGELTLPEGFRYSIHSQNPIGVKNIDGWMNDIKSYLESESDIKKPEVKSKVSEDVRRLELRFKEHNDLILSPTTKTSYTEYKKPIYSARKNIVTNISKCNERNKSIAIQLLRSYLLEHLFNTKNSFIPKPLLSANILNKIIKQSSFTNGDITVEIINEKHNLNDIFTLNGIVYNEMPAGCVYSATLLVSSGKESVNYVLNFSNSFHFKSPNL